jgi:hypothetical protein
MGAEAKRARVLGAASAVARYDGDMSEDRTVRLTYAELVRELQEKLEAEMSEHRRVVSLMAESLAVRRSWWPWRRRT